MGDEVSIDPFNAVADVGGHRSRRKRKSFSLDLDRLGARRHGNQAEQEHAERSDRRCERTGTISFELGGDVLGVLLVALENLQPGRP